VQIDMSTINKCISSHVNANTQAKEENRTANPCGGEQGKHQFDEEFSAFVGALIA
jgi:hypothetical protein